MYGHTLSTRPSQLGRAVAAAGLPASLYIHMPGPQAVYMRALGACRTRLQSGQKALRAGRTSLSPTHQKAIAHMAGRTSLSLTHHMAIALMACHTSLPHTHQYPLHSWRAALVCHQLSPMQSPRRMCIGKLIVRSSHKHVHDSLGLHPDTTTSSSPRAGLSRPRVGCT